MKQGKIRRKKKYDYCAYAMILPAYFVFALFVVLPIFAVVYYSFTDYDMFNSAAFVGLKNYKRLMADSLFLKAVGNTVKYSLGTVGPQLVLALILAVMLFQKSKLVNFFRTCIYLPYVISMVCTAMIWMWIFDPSSGFANKLIVFLGGDAQTWLSDPNLAMLCLIVTGIWKSVGYSTVIYLSGLTAIPSELYEAAKIDGANGIQQFWHISLPLLKSSTVFLLITGMIGSFSVFEQVNIMTSGGPVNSTTTIVHQIYIRGFQSNQMGYASAMGVVLLIASCILTFLIFRLDRKDA
jgi:ABC-type sugar transport system permease subunit